jgi:hypothetical protein
MPFRIAHLVLVALAGSLPATAQSPAPKLSKPQRDALHKAITAVDAAARQPDTSDVDWQIHLLRASDGSHYVAFSVRPREGELPATPTVLYVRLASRHDPPSSVAERSAVMEWLEGLRTDPLPLRPARVVFVASGELPIGGTAAMSTRSGGVGQSSGALALIEREREREREQKEAYERNRKAALEGKATEHARDLYPFEDFDVSAVAMSPDPGRPGTPVLRRSLTTGPGEFDLYVGWIDPGTAAARVYKKAISLPPASTATFALSSVILADDVKVRATPYGSAEQSAHPYSIGVTDVTPAADEVFTSEERLALVFQAINPQASAAGKPDVAITFRLFRTTAAGEEPVGVLNPQQYTAETLPADFDVAKGHPLFVAVAVPLAKLPRGSYRLAITGNDRLAGVIATADASFRVVGTARTLLSAAPPLGSAFRRQAALEPPVLESVVGALTPERPSPALARLLAALRAGRFTELLKEETLDPGEQGVRLALRGIGFYALGDTPRLTAVQLQQALQQSAPAAPVHVFLGACRALEGNEREAALSWQTAYDAGVAAPQAGAWLVNSYLRQGDATRADALARKLAADAPGTWSRAITVSAMAGNREADAIALLEARLKEQPDDEDAEFLLLQALFSAAVRDESGARANASRDRFAEVAREYVDRAAPHAALVQEWLDVWPGR